MNETAMVHRVRAVLVGGIAALGDKGVVSGIAKRPVHVPVHVSSLGLTGDAQADLRVHGSIDKAVHCYPWAHYERWREELVPDALLDEPGAFGENMSVEGLDEHDVCIGDKWRIGTAVFEVSQGRQPCFKLNLRFGIRDMALRVQTSLRAGWYLRVLEQGWVTAGDPIERLHRPFPSHSTCINLPWGGVRPASASAAWSAISVPNARNSVAEIQPPKDAGSTDEKGRPRHSLTAIVISNRHPMTYGVHHGGNAQMPAKPMANTLAAALRAWMKTQQASCWV